MTTKPQGYWNIIFFEKKVRGCFSCTFAKHVFKYQLKCLQLNHQKNTPPKTNMVHLKMENPWNLGDPYWFHHHFQVNQPLIFGGVSLHLVPGFLASRVIGLILVDQAFHLQTTSDSRDESDEKHRRYMGLVRLCFTIPSLPNTS